MKMKTLLVSKHSKFEWEQKLFGLNENELKAKLIAEQANIDTILESHHKQLQTRHLMMEVFASCDTMMMDDVTDADWLKRQEYDLIMVLGGDNSFTNVSHYVGDTPILGINSDPDRSVGSLTSWGISTPQDAFDLLEKIEFQHFDIQEWTRLEAVLNGKMLPPATSEIFLGETKRNYMSRHVLEYEGQSYEQKCSGLIVATGAGSTGWYKSANRMLRSWKPTERKAGFVVSEPYNDDACANYTGVIGGSYGPSIKIYSLNDDQGIISIDSWDEFEFKRGSTVEIHIGSPLNVLIPIEG